MDFIYSFIYLVSSAAPLCRLLRSDLLRPAMKQQSVTVGAFPQRSLSIIHIQTLYQTFRYFFVWFLFKNPISTIPGFYRSFYVSSKGFSRHLSPCVLVMWVRSFPSARTVTRLVQKIFHHASRSNTASPQQAKVLNDWIYISV